MTHLLHDCNTRYEWLVSPCSIGTCTQSETPSFLAHRRLSSVGLPQDFLKLLSLVFQATAPASFERNRAFLSLASRKSCEDCPVWGAISLLRSLDDFRRPFIFAKAPSKRPAFFILVLGAYGPIRRKTDMLRCPDFSQDLKASLFEIRLVAVNRTVSCLYWFSLNTPKALANFSPAVGAAATTLGYEF